MVLLVSGPLLALTLHAEASRVLYWLVFALGVVSAVAVERYVALRFGRMVAIPNAVVV